MDRQSARSPYLFLGRGLGLFRGPAQARLAVLAGGEVEIERSLFLARRGLDRLLVLAGRQRLLIAYGAADAEQLPEAGDGDEKGIAILLGSEGLPLHNRAHGPPNSGLLADDAADLAWLAVADRRKEDGMCHEDQQAERNQDKPTSLSPLPDNLSQEDRHSEGQGQRRASEANASSPSRALPLDVGPDRPSHRRDGKE